MKISKIQKTTIAALFAALTCVATFAFKIPTPATNGYIHLGDTIVILSGIFLGPVYGALAAGIGSSLADLIGGYFIYAPITFLIKAFAAFAVSIAYRKAGKVIRRTSLRCAFSGIFSTLIVVIGYFIFQLFLYQSAAILEIPGSFVQGLSGLIIASILAPILVKFPAFRQLTTTM